jgi:regulator of nonsense transcripts 3
MPEEVTLPGDKDNDKPLKGVKKTKTFLNKVIIRKLPPNMSSSEFLESVQPLQDYSDYYFVNADWSLGAEATSRAYIEFKNQEDASANKFNKLKKNYFCFQIIYLQIFIFKDKFDGYVFLDNVKGTEYSAIVEYAPFQGLTKARARKKDKNSGTIESEQHFLNFLEMLKKAEESENQKTDLKVEYSYQIKDDKKITSTPLLEFIAASKEEKREAKVKYIMILFININKFL